METDNTVTVVIRNQSDLANIMGHLSGIKPSFEDPYTVAVTKEDESRSLRQNKIFFLWMLIRSGMTGHGAAYERQTCKLLYGCEILREDKDFNKFFEEVIAPLTYEQQMDSMEWIPVTRLMSMHQFAELLETIDRESAAIGIVLPRPSDLYFDALMKDAEDRQ